VKSPDTIIFRMLSLRFGVLIFKILNGEKLKNIIDYLCQFIFTLQR